MTDLNGNKFSAVNAAVNGLLVEVMRFVLFFVIFLWFASAINSRLATQRNRISAIEKHLDLKPPPER